MVKPSTESKKNTLIFWGLIATIFISIDIIANIYSQRSSLYDILMVPWIRVAILSLNLTIVSTVIVVTGLIIQRVFPHQDKPTTRKRNIIFFICFSIFIFLYAASWLSFHYTGIFLNTDIFKMLANDPVQLMQHVTHISPLTLIFAITSTLFVAAMLVLKLDEVVLIIVNKYYTISKNIMLFCFTLIAVGGVTSVIVVSLYNGKITDVNTGIGYTPIERFNETISQRTGPISSVVWEIKKSVLSLISTNEKINNKSLTTRKIITTEEYLSHTKDFNKKNIIVLLVESLRSDQFPIYGGKETIMPTLQKMAAQSLVYTNAYATSSHSNYSDLAPLSSHYPLRSINVHYYPKNPSYPRVLLQDILKPLGYKTAIISSQNEHWGNMLNYLDTGNFDYILHAENYKGTLRQSFANNSAPDDPLMGDKKQGKIDDKFTINAAIDWIGEQKEQPFMLYMNLQSSHFPYDVSDKYLTDSSYNKPKLPKFIGSNLVIKDEDKDEFKKAYQDSLKYIDNHISRLIQHLKEKSLLEDTIIVVSADTATAFFEHGQWGNGGPLYDEVVKVPLFIYNSDITHTIDTTLTSHIDIMPTILDMLKLPLHPSFQGISTLSTSIDTRSVRPIFLVCQSPVGYQYAVVQNNWKLIFDGNQGRKILYKLDGANPEKHDYSNEKPALNTSMTNLLFTWMNTQIDYYQQKPWHQKEYPPIVNEVP